MMLARDVRHVLDPVELALDLGIKPDHWQAALLRSDARRAILNCSRQAGKTTVVAVIALWTAIYMPGSTTLMIAPSQRQSVELFRRFRDFYLKLTGVPREVLSSLTRTELASGSRVIALPGSETSARGFTADLILVDEAARVPDEVIAAIRPTLSTTDGRLVLLSTPYGKRGTFYDTWTNGDREWHRVSVVAKECPRISTEFLARELAELGPMLFGQEYEGEFVDTGDQLFDSSIVERAFTDEIAPLWESAA